MILTTVLPIVLTMGFLGFVFSLKPVPKQRRVPGRDYR